ncbi:putative epoxide hydrolase [Mollisia scopiformis]|uniref:Putative epoxide hydrolase n=1 Tax=Mollisia scopiformis TaxID=149040 RepID=A0A194XKI5_MOLSC|nr:putative epoxide hydrolase [Mollisia scopiformis]KUJ20302.1 putative epoxide hydrolase [Mollisia scopiformis]
MFPNFESFDLKLSSSLTIHGIRSGSGQPLLLLHGFPQTHHIWHKVAPELTSKYTVIAIDLRGYGKSSKLPSDEKDSHKAYAKSTMAEDCVKVMSGLGYEKFWILSHDRGARIAHKLCVDYPEKVGKLMMLDIAPTLAMFEKTDQEFATKYWHWFFLIQPSPFPENILLNNREELKARFFGGSWSGVKGFMDEKAVEEYISQFTDKAGVHAMCEDYRAAATIDLVEARSDKEAGRKIKCPVRVLWGKNGVIEKSFDCLGEWRAVCDNEVSGEAVNSGHFIAEEVPNVLLKHVREFFG